MNFEEVVTGNSFGLDVAAMRRMIFDENELYDLYLLGGGAYNPLKGFINDDDFECVLKDMRLCSGELWTVPIVKSISSEEFAKKNYMVGEQVLIGDGKDPNNVHGLLTIESVYKHDRTAHATNVYGTDDINHPGVRNIFENMGEYLVGGKVDLFTEGVLPFGYLFGDHVSFTKKYHRTPEETRKIMFEDNGWEKVSCFQTRNPLHKSHEFLLHYALQETDGLLLHPLVGQVKKGDLKNDIRMAAYEMLIDVHHKTEDSNIFISMYPAWMRYGGPREAVFHALVRRNYGCTHFIVGRDHAGAGGYYGPYDAQELLKKFAEEIQITPILIPEIIFCEHNQKFSTKGECVEGLPEPHDKLVSFLSGTKVRDMIGAFETPPSNFVRGDVADLLIGSKIFDEIVAGNPMMVLDELENNGMEVFGFDNRIQKEDLVIDDISVFLLYAISIYGEVIKYHKFETLSDVYLLMFMNYTFIDIKLNSLDKKSTARKMFLITGDQRPERIDDLYQDVIQKVYSSDSGGEGKRKKNAVLWFTGLPCSGKTTIAKKLRKDLLAMEHSIYVEHFDGDYVRKIMNRDLGFSASDRTTNLKRISKVMKKINSVQQRDQTGILMASFVSPYIEARQRIKKEVDNKNVEFFMIYVDTPLEVCEKRDVKGMYKLARKGIIKKFTGIDDPYEAPPEADLIIKTDEMNVDESVKMVIKVLKERGVL